MGQYEILQIIEKYGDLKNGGKRLTTKEIVRIYNEEIRPIQYGNVYTVLTRLRKQRCVGFDCFLENRAYFYYWKKDMVEFNGAI